jgi:hypothetical protein
MVPALAKGLEERLSKGESTEAVLREMSLLAQEIPEGQGLAHFLSALGLLITNQFQAALGEFAAAQEAWPEGKPIIRFFQATGLGLLRRHDEAFAALEASRDELWGEIGWLEAAYPPLAPQISQFKEDFYKRWTLPGLAQGLEGLAGYDRRAWQDGAEKVVVVLRHAQEDGQESAVWSVITQVEQAFPPEWRSQITEFRTFVQLIAIDDPFEGLEALAKSISAVWPEGVDCVDAVREQRR